MASLHLELEIDSDVHPELYARLASIERSPARQEKLRQLAATGLIWEIARLHGPAFSEPEAVEPASPPSRPFDLGGDLARAVDAGSASDHALLVPDDVPVLVDVVNQAEMDGARIEVAAAAPVLAPALTVVEASGPPSPAGVPHGRTQSARIRRMKESGLFQSG